jgi:hypothetical protein
MVNAKFPKRNWYGFEMVDDCLQLPWRHQSKIYGESNRSAFLQIFGDFASMQILAVYRRLLRKGSIARSIAADERRRTGLRNVFPASHGILARAGAGAVAQREDA